MEHESIVYTKVMALKVFKIHLVEFIDPPEFISLAAIFHSNDLRSVACSLNYNFPHRVAGPVLDLNT